jgi:hypothetical protein
MRPGMLTGTSSPRGPEAEFACHAKRICSGAAVGRYPGMVERRGI